MLPPRPERGHTSGCFYVKNKVEACCGASIHPPSERSSSRKLGFRYRTFLEDEYVHGMTSKDANHQAAKVLYDLEMGLWEANMSTLIYDEEQDCFRSRDRRFAFSKTKADWKLLEELGYAS